MSSSSTKRWRGRYFQTKIPLGQRLDIGYRRTSGTRPREIVGIVADVREMGLDRPAPPAYYVPYRQDPMSNMYVVARTDVDASSLMPAIGREVHEMDPGLAILTERTLDQTVALSLTDRRMTAGFLVGFALLALVLAMIGVNGVMAYSVAQRRSEIGIRMALGARAQDVLVMFVRSGFLVALAGVALGLAGALVLTRQLQEMLFEVEATDPMTYTFVAVLLVMVSVLASLIPARRATLTDPLKALRSE